MRDVVERPEDARVLDAREELVLALRRAGDRVAGEGLGGGNAVDADAAMLVRQVLVRPEEVLEVLPLEEEVAEGVAADAPEPLRGANAGLLEGAAEGAREAGVDGAEPRIGELLGAGPGEVPADSGELRPVVAAEDERPPLGRELHGEVLRGAEDDGVDVGGRELREGLLALEERLELLRLLVREEERVVGEALPPVRLPAPGTGVAREAAPAALDLDEEKAFSRDDEGVDFVDGAVPREELEVREAAVRLLVGERLPEVVEGFLLVSEARRRDLRPPLRVGLHVLAPPVGPGRAPPRIIPWRRGWRPGGVHPDCGDGNPASEAPGLRPCGSAVRPRLPSPAVASRPHRGTG